jgi:hypothetical protein
MDFLAPQPFNVEIGPEPDVAAPVRMPVLGPAVPVVAQEITEDRDLYPVRSRRGVRNGVVR